ncbi:MAG: MBL fold metallo-hydrolase RNA specificity domain-containing protein [Planctomycetota bacterium]|jgi:metallo-beta-lactamase family protein
MQIKLQFLGAAQNVTGSRHLLEANGTRLLVDCGLYQERQFRARNWEPFTVPPESMDAVLLTHAHLDHCGLLPKLVKDGFKGKIYCTEATAEIARIILLDSAKLQEEDAAYKRKRHEREGRKGPFPEVPLYTVADAEATLPHFSGVKYRQPVHISAGIEATFCEAGHVLGSSIIKVKVGRNGQDRTVLFSGDVGRPHRPIVRDPALVDEADYILVESTYGDRVHKGPEDTKKMIAEVINETKQAGGNIIVPSFALERSQELLYYVNELLLEDAIPRLKVFLDSPMAASITKVFRRHRELYDKETKELLKNNTSPFSFPGLKMTGTSDESKAINHIRETVMVIAGSGMCTGGRIKHHLVNNIAKPRNTIMFVGYQAVGTLGRRIVNGEKQVRILGQEYPVKARVVRINGFSAHADKEELLKWLSGLKRPPRKLFVVHGEAESARHFGDFISEKTGWQVAVPAYQDEVVLD